MRKLATIRKISELRPIPEADLIETAVLDGWEVVVKKDEHKVGDLVVYCEIDSWIPYDLAPFLCRGKEPREYNGVAGERLRTIRLRGQLSQGLILNTFPSGAVEGEDVTELLGIQLYEKPIPAQLAGLTKGYFPSFIPKTDEERVQNLVSDLSKWEEHIWEVTEKLDGSSMTVYWNNEEFGVCSRNLDLKRDENNTFWKTAISLGIEEQLDEYGRNLAIQGELIGEGIQGNKYNIKGHRFYVFNIFDIDSGKYLNKTTRNTICKALGLNQVPELNCEYSSDVKTLLSLAEGKSELNPNTEREGIVWKSQTDISIHFKAISNKFLLKDEAKNS